MPRDHSESFGLTRAKRKAKPLIPEDHGSSPMKSEAFHSSRTGVDDPSIGATPSCPPESQHLNWLSSGCDSAAGRCFQCVFRLIPHIQPWANGMWEPHSSGRPTPIGPPARPCKIRVRPPKGNWTGTKAGLSLISLGDSPACVA